MNELHFEYLDKAESVFILSLIKHIDCLHCPDYHLGCGGGYTLSQAMNMANRDYVERQIPGTEPFLCGKLRNIIIAEDVNLYELKKQFNNTLKNNVGYLSKEENRCIVNDVNIDIIKSSLEAEYQRQLQKIVREANERLLQYQNDVRQEYEKQIKELHNIISELKLRLGYSE